MADNGRTSWVEWLCKTLFIGCCCVPQHNNHKPQNPAPAPPVPERSLHRQPTRRRHIERDHVHCHRRNLPPILELDHITTAPRGNSAPRRVSSPTRTTPARATPASVSPNRDDPSGVDTSRVTITERHRESDSPRSMLVSLYPTSNDADNEMKTSTILPGSRYGEDGKRVIKNTNGQSGERPTQYEEEAEAQGPQKGVRQMEDNRWSILTDPPIGASTPREGSPYMG